MKITKIKFLFLSLSQQTHDVVSTSIRRLYDIGDVVQTSYRRRNDAVCLLGYVGMYFVLVFNTFSLYVTGHKMQTKRIQMFQRCPGRLLIVLYTLNLRPLAMRIVYFQSMNNFSSVITLIVNVICHLRACSLNTYLFVLFILSFEVKT